MVMQYTISACGLNEQDQATLMSFLKVLNLGGISLWDYSDEDAAADVAADVVLVDSDHQEGQEFIWAYQIGVHDGKIMVSVGEDTSGCQVAHCLIKPLRCDNLREIFDELIDSEGHLVSSEDHLVSSDIHYSDENLIIHISG